MSAQVSLNLYKLRKNNKMRDFAKILIIFRNKFDTFNNI